MKINVRFYAVQCSYGLVFLSCHLKFLFYFECVMVFDSAMEVDDHPKVEPQPSSAATPLVTISNILTLGVWTFYFSLRLDPSIQKLLNVLGSYWHHDF